MPWTSGDFLGASQTTTVPAPTPRLRRDGRPGGGRWWEEGSGLLPPSPMRRCPEIEGRDLSEVVWSSAVRPEISFRK